MSDQTPAIKEKVVEGLATRSPVLALLVYIGWQLSTLCTHAQDWQPRVTVQLEGPCAVDGYPTSEVPHE